MKVSSDELLKSVYAAGVGRTSLKSAGAGYRERLETLALPSPRTVGSTEAI